MKTKDVKLNADQLTAEIIESDIKQAKGDRYDELTYTAEPHLTINLKDLKMSGEQMIIAMKAAKESNLIQKRLMETEKKRRKHFFLAYEKSPKEDSLIGFYLGFRGDSLAIKIFFTQWALILGFCYAYHHKMERFK